MVSIKVENLKYRYPLTTELAIDDVSFSIGKGAFIGVVGGNNAGKSTLCHALSGIIPHFYKGAYGGKVFIGDLEVAAASVDEVCQKVGIIFQNPFNQITGSKLTVYEEVAFGLENFGVDPSEMKVRIEDALERLHILEYKDRNPFGLSGGQMQRLAIASVIAMKPDIIILDEPTSQLDPKGTAEVFEAIDILSEQGITIIIVEHKMERLVKHCDQIMLMDQGKLIDFATPEEIFSRADIESYGIDIPVYTKLCKALNKKMANGLYPVTLEATQTLLGKKASK